MSWDRVEISKGYHSLTQRSCSNFHNYQVVLHEMCDSMRGRQGWRLECHLRGPEGWGRRQGECAGDKALLRRPEGETCSLKVRGCQRRLSFRFGRGLPQGDQERRRRGWGGWLVGGEDDQEIGDRVGSQWPEAELWVGEEGLHLASQG